MVDALQYGRPVRAFALRIEGRVMAYLNRRLHVPTKPDWLPGVFLESGQELIICSVHGARCTVHVARWLVHGARCRLRAERRPLHRWAVRPRPAHRDRGP